MPEKEKMESDRERNNRRNEGRLKAKAASRVTLSLLQEVVSRARAKTERWRRSNERRAYGERAVSSEEIHSMRQE